MASTLTREHVSLRKLVWIGPLVIICTAIVNVIVRTVAVAFFGVSSTFSYFQLPYIIGSTIIYLLLAILAFVLVSRFARQPIRFYCMLALVALLVSLLFPVMALNGSLATPGMNIHIFWTMIVMPYYLCRAGCWSANHTDPSARIVNEARNVYASL